MTTGNPSIASNSPAKSLRCIGSSFCSAFLRVFSSRARIIACMCGIRSSAKNICSVRQSPMPSAPNSARLLGIARDIRVCAHAEIAAEFVRPSP